VKCWGDNNSYATGDGVNTTTGRSTPVSVVGVGGVGVLSNVVSIAGGFQHYCALLADTSVVCWGADAQGQLGDGGTTNSSKPVVVAGLSGAAQVIAGYDYSCARLTSGSVQCWGGNAYGQIGDGTTTNRSAPTLVKF
jgi:alpha-tubulin suppressor-like RCC1 family protein